MSALEGLEDVMVWGVWPSPLPLYRKRGTLLGFSASHPACMPSASLLFHSKCILLKQTILCPATVGPWSSALTQVVGLSCALAHMRWVMLALALAWRR